LRDQVAKRVMGFAASLQCRLLGAGRVCGSAQAGAADCRAPNCMRALGYTAALLLSLCARWLRPS
jgi:hypothetical protein